MKKLLLSALISGLITPIAYAEDGIETVQVTGSRLDNTVISSMSSLERADIESLNPSTTLDVLRQLPGVLISENKGASGFSFVSVRGGESNFTLIQIDGITVNDPTNSRGGGFDFSLIDPEAIERVEVYRGGVSAVYGGDAVSGIINIITRKSDGIALSVSAGTDDFTSVSAHIGGSFAKDWSYALGTAAREQSTGSFENYENRNTWASIEYTGEKATHAFTMRFVEQDSQGFAEDSGGELYAIPAIAEDKSADHLLIGYRNKFTLNNGFSLHSQVSWSDATADANHPGIAPGVFGGVPASVITSTYEKLDAEAYVQWKASSDVTVVTGISYRDAEGANEGTLDFGFPLPVNFTLEQDIFSAFSEASFTFGKFDARVGLRHDNPDEFSSETSFSANTNYAISESLSLFVNYDEGYKLPSFFALAHPLIGNADLAPEDAKNLSLGLTGTFAKTTFEIAAFSNEYRNLVDFDPEQFTSVNRSRVDSEGVELNGSAVLTDWLNLSISTTYSDTDNADNTTLRRRPKWFGSAELQANWDDFSVNLSAHARDAFYDSSIPTGLVQMGGYSVSNLSAKWQVTENLALKANVENIFDKSYEESVGFLIDESQARIGLVFTL